MAFPLGEGLNSLVSWIVHLHRAQPTSVTHLAVSAAGSDQPATSASAAAADASAARAKQAGTSQIGGAAADHPSDVQSPAGPGGSLLLLPAASSAAGLAVQGGKIVGFSLRCAAPPDRAQYRLFPFSFDQMRSCHEYTNGSPVGGVACAVPGTTITAQCVVSLAVY